MGDTWLLCSLDIQSISQTDAVQYMVYSSSQLQDSQWIIIQQFHLHILIQTISSPSSAIAT